MKQLNIIIAISVLLWSCSQNKPKRENIDVQKNEKTIVETKKDTSELIKEITIEKVDSIEQYLIKKAPCIELQEFVVDIEKLNWVPDNKRLHKVNIYEELDRQKVEYFNDKPFYQISFENSSFNTTYNAEIFESDFDSLDYKLFQGVDNIWGYFYRDKKATSSISDGVIEQWEFKTEEEAEKALKQIFQPGFTIYFNTNPYFCRIRNKLIIFQTRAMAFSYDQKSIFEKFVKEKAPSTLYE